MSNLIKHARCELELLGEDEETTEGLIKVIQAFADMGHSGFSAEACTQYLEKLLRYENLTAITDNPAEWNPVEPPNLWQSARNPKLFSTNGGETYYDVTADVRVYQASHHKEL